MLRTAIVAPWTWTCKRDLRPGAARLAAFLAVCAIYLLFLRNSVMWGFLCILGIVALFVIQVSPDMLDNF